MDLVSLGLGLLSGGGGGLLGGKLTNSTMGKGAQMLTGIVGGTGLAALAPMIPGLEGVFASPADGAGLNVSSILGGVVSGGIGGRLQDRVFFSVFALTTVIKAKMGYRKRVQ